MIKRANIPDIGKLYHRAGPIIRYRLVREFGYSNSQTLNELRDDVMRHPEVTRWLSNLGSQNVHGSKDTDAENPLAKLVEFGLHSGISQVDSAVEKYLDMIPGAIILHGGDIVQAGAPFLVALGYGSHKHASAWVDWRLEVLRENAGAMNFDFYLTDEQKIGLPKVCRDKWIFQHRFFEDGMVRFPTCYDLYALSYWRPASEGQQKAIQEVVRFMADERFQNTPGGYLWDGESRRHYAAGGVVLAKINPDRRLLILRLFASFPFAIKQTWFQQELGHLQTFEKNPGVWSFPPEYLKEKRNSYAIYSGAHMGLGENRRKKDWIEIESTFRMIEILAKVSDSQ